LIAGGGRTRLFEVDELIRLEAQDLGQVGAVAPTGEEVPYPCERVAAPLQTADQLEPAEVRPPVYADAAAAGGWRQQPDRLVLANRPYRERRLAGELVDGQATRSHGSTITSITVTVFTVIIAASTISAALGQTWPDVDVKAAQPLTGGEWATMFRLRLAGTPDGVPDDVVLRVVPDAAMGAKELAVQTSAYAAGIPTPRVHMTGDAGGPLGGAWSLMDFVEGAPLLANLDGASALTRLPALLRRLPRQLAATTAVVHRVEPGPVEARVRAAAPTVAFTVDEVFAHLRGAGVSHDPLVRAMDALDATRPPVQQTVLCHGDLHPFNLLTDGDRVTVLDWTAAIVAPPAYDVAWTWLLLRHPPLEATPAMRRAIDAGAAVLARRFLRDSRRLVPGLDADELHWYTALHAARILIDLGRWAIDGDERAEAHPLRLVAPGAIRLLRRTTGVAIDLDAPG
jgi:aminoglycoside phosphotransferase (APT) family kinase protein